MKEFKDYLIRANLADRTINSYIFSVKSFIKKYKDINKINLLKYKEELIYNFKPKTVNLRIQGINRYLSFIKKGNLKLKFVKVQQKTFLENVISNADYNFFKNKLKSAGNMLWYFEVRFLAATGARVSELLQFKVEHVMNGYFDIYSKGGKTRRIYIPQELKKATMNWLEDINKKSGFIFTCKNDKLQTQRHISRKLKNLAKKYGINPKVVYPHSFRHLFAKNFIEKYNDISLLADLMGHDSIDTTRIYLRRTATEQQTLIDSIITW